MLGWSSPVGIISLGCSDVETNIADIWFSGAGEAFELGGPGGSLTVVGKECVWGAESSLSNKAFFQYFGDYKNSRYHGL